MSRSSSSQTRRSPIGSASDQGQCARLGNEDVEFARALATMDGRSASALFGEAEPWASQRQNHAGVAESQTHLIAVAGDDDALAHVTSMNRSVAHTPIPINSSA